MAWVVIAAGAGVGLLGLVLLTRFGLATFRGELMKDLAGWGSLDLRGIEPGKLRRSLKDVWKENPRLAAQMDENLRSFEEVKRSDPSAVGNAERYFRIMYVARYAAMAMVLLGVAGIAFGLWLRAS